jgi:Flp pilus assembly pilin Flp
MNPMNDLFVAYVWSAVRVRIDRARADDGASAIEWAIITGLLAMIALGVGVVILRKVRSAAHDIKIH